MLLATIKAAAMGPCYHVESSLNQRLIEHVEQLVDWKSHGLQSYIWQLCNLFDCPFFRWRHIALFSQKCSCIQFKLLILTLQKCLMDIVHVGLDTHGAWIRFFYFCVFRTVLPMHYFPRWGNDPPPKLTMPKCAAWLFQWCFPLIHLLEYPIPLSSVTKKPGPTSSSCRGANLWLRSGAAKF